GGPGPWPALAGALATPGRPWSRRYVEAGEISDRGVRWQPRTPGVVWRGRALETDMANVLERRVVDALAETADISGHPLLGGREAELDDVRAFLAGEVDDERLTELFRAFLALEPDALQPQRENNNGPAS